MRRFSLGLAVLVTLAGVSVMNRSLGIETLEKRRLLAAMAVQPLYYDEIPWHEIDNVKLGLQSESALMYVRAVRFGGDPNQTHDDGANDTNKPVNLPPGPDDPLVEIGRHEWGGAENNDWVAVVESQQLPWQPNGDYLRLPNGTELSDWTRLTLLRRQGSDWYVVLVVHNDGWIRQTHLAQAGVPSAPGSSMIIGPHQTLVDANLNETRVYANVKSLIVDQATDEKPVLEFDYRQGGSATLSVQEVSDQELVYEVKRNYVSQYFAYVATMWAVTDIQSDASALTVQTIGGDANMYHLTELKEIAAINDVRSLAVHRWEQSNHNSTGPGIVVSFADPSEQFHSVWMEAEQQQVTGSINDRSEMSGRATSGEHKTVTLGQITTQPVLPRGGWWIPAIRYGHHESSGLAAQLNVDFSIGGISIGAQQIALDPTDTTPFSGIGRNTPGVVYGTPQQIDNPAGLEVVYQNVTAGVSPEIDVVGFLYLGDSLLPPTAGDDHAQLPKNGMTQIDVLANDFDPNSQTLQIQLGEAPEHGVATVNNGVVNFEPSADFVGNDKFTYTVTDPDGGISAATVFVVVTADDFGDAPAPYPTLIVDMGAKHVAIGPRLGASRDGENDGVPSTSADADDNDGPVDDEDGVMFGVIGLGSPMAAVNIDLQNATDARVDAWLDFDRNGVWDATDQILDSVQVIAGLQTLNFTIPAGAVVGEHLRAGPRKQCR